MKTSMFCKINAIFSTGAGVNSFLYNASFCICIIMMIRKPLAHTEKKYKKYFHFINVTAVIIFVLIYQFQSKLGLNALGTCSVKEPSVTSVFPILIYICLSGYTIYYLKKIMKNQTQEEKNPIINNYIKYIIFTVVTWSIICSSWTYSEWIKNMDIDHNMGLTIFIFSLGNIAKIGSSLALSYYARFKDPTFRPKIEEKCPCLKAKKKIE